MPPKAALVFYYLEVTVSEYTDRTVTCRDCGKPFTFTAGEQEFFASRGFSEPTRCADCRAVRKAERDSGGFGGRRGSGGPRQMFQAVCADCGATTEVPFEPRQDRPVYCRDCFEKRNPRR